MGWNSVVIGLHRSAILGFCGVKRATDRLVLRTCAFNRADYRSLVTSNFVDDMFTFAAVTPRPFSTQLWQKECFDVAHWNALRLRPGHLLCCHVRWETTGRILAQA